VPARVTDPKLTQARRVPSLRLEYGVQRSTKNAVAAKGQLRFDPVFTGPNQSRHLRHEPTMTGHGEAQAVG
jgi:hypothetical protein